MSITWPIGVVRSATWGLAGPEGEQARGGTGEFNQTAVGEPRLEEAALRGLSGAVEAFDHD